MNWNIFKIVVLASLSTFTLSGHGAIAAGSHSGGHGPAKESGTIGKAGDPAKVDRSIAITMGDNYFAPKEIRLKAGETIRFVVSNKGEFLHEFNIGTAAMHAAHQKEMAEMMEHGMITATGIDHKMMKMGAGGGKMMMQHNDPNSVLLEPGKQAEVIWRFSQEAKLEFACNVPGHYESGMMGRIHLQHAH